MNASLDELLINCSELNNNLSFELFNAFESLSNGLSNAPSSLKSFFKFLKTRELSYDESLRLINSLNVLIDSYFFQAFDELSIIDYPLFNWREVIDEQLTVEQVNERIKALYSSPEFIKALSDYRSRIKEGINDLYRSIKEFKPEWTKDPLVKEKLTIIVNSNEILELAAVASSLTKELRSFIDENLSNLEMICCPYCSSFNVETLNEIVCRECGTIIGPVFSEQERRAYTKQEVESRKHHEPTWHCFGPRTLVGQKNELFDYKGVPLKGDSRYLIQRLQKIQRSLVSSIERNFWEAKPKLKLFEETYPEYVIETAWTIYREAARLKLTMGRSISQFVGTALYAAVKVCGFPKLMREVVEDIENKLLVFRKDLSRGLKELNRRSVLERLNLSYQNLRLSDYLSHYCSRIKMKDELIKETVSLTDCLVNGRGHLIFGLDPAGVMAAAIYTTLKQSSSPDLRTIIGELNKYSRKNFDRVTQSLIARYMDVTEVTLRTTAKYLKFFSVVDSVCKKFDINSPTKHSVYNNFKKIMLKHKKFLNNHNKINFIRSLTNAVIHYVSSDPEIKEETARLVGNSLDNYLTLIKNAQNRK